MPKKAANNKFIQFDRLPCDVCVSERVSDEENQEPSCGEIL